MRSFKVPRFLPEVQSFKVPGFQGSRISFQGSRFQDSRVPGFLVQVASTEPGFQQGSKSSKVPGVHGSRSFQGPEVSKFQEGLDFPKLVEVDVVGMSASEGTRVVGHQGCWSACGRVRVYLV